MKNVNFIIAVPILFAVVCGLTWAQEESSNGENSDSVQVNEENLEILDTQDPEVEIEEGLNSFSVWDFVRMVLILGGVIAVIYGIFFFLKKVGNPKYSENSLISVVATQNLQGNRSVHLIEVGNELLLIGSAEGSVRLIKKIEDGETLDTIKLHRSEAHAGEGNFSQTLRGIFKKGSDVTPTTRSKVDDGALFLQKQRERLKNM